MRWDRAIVIVFFLSRWICGTPFMVRWLCPLNIGNLTMAQIAGLGVLSEDQPKIPWTTKCCCLHVYLNPIVYNTGLIDENEVPSFQWIIIIVHSKNWIWGPYTIYFPLAWQITLESPVEFGHGWPGWTAFVSLKNINIGWGQAVWRESMTLWALQLWPFTSYKY